jgi:predicted nucleic acid-binding protein
VSLVLDSSATLAWIYSDETTDAIRALFDQVADAGAVVPSLWRLEVANSLTIAVRRGRIDVDFRRAALADLALLDITTDQPPGMGRDVEPRRSLSAHRVRCGLS